MKQRNSTQQIKLSLRLTLILCFLISCSGFTHPHLTKTCNYNSPWQKLPLPTPTTLSMAYAPPEDAERTKLTSPKLPTPKIGDIVRYYDIDGGNTQGQILVGKISLIQPILQSSPNDDGTNRWLVELTELQDVGDNYYAEYPSRKRRRSSLRKLEEVAPLAASFVRSEDAYKIPMERGTNIPLPYAVYDVANYEGPNDQPVNVDVVRADGETYNNVKLSLLKNTALAGVVGTIVAELTRGTEDALIYLAGSTAGVLYLYFLGIKTDTVGSVDAKLGSNVSNLRFVFPALVLTGVALNNVVNNNSEVHGIFSTVTPEQFGAAMIGFLTYRVPLFVSQLFPVLFDSVSDVLPGSAGMAVRMAAEAKKRGLHVSSLDKEKEKDGLVTVLLVSGPEGTGKSTLVQRLMDEDERFVRPILQDRVADGIKFERMEQREEFLEVDKSGRYGLAKEGILQAAAKTTGDDSSTSKVVVVDADVSLAKKLVSIAEARLVGVWVGLDSLEKFESRLMAKIQSGSVTIPDGVTEEELLRIKVNQAVKDIEYGLVCGLFEFTILNDDIDESVKELKEAASYCFK